MAKGRIAPRLQIPECPHQVTGTMSGAEHSDEQASVIPVPPGLTDWWETTSTSKLSGVKREDHRRCSGNNWNGMGDYS